MMVNLFVKPSFNISSSLGLETSFFLIGGGLSLVWRIVIVTDISGNVGYKIIIAQKHGRLPINLTVFAIQADRKSSPVVLVLPCIASLVNLGRLGASKA